MSARMVSDLVAILDGELMAAVERGEPDAWGRSNRIADAALTLLPELDRASSEIPQARVGALHALYTEFRRTMSDGAARASAIANLCARLREAVQVGSTRRPTTRPRLVVPPAQALPAWLPPSGFLGAFRVLRPMASGALGTLFLARRETPDGDAIGEEVVLKVPHDASFVPHVTDAELMDAFRAEAAALVAMRRHPNLAHIVAFDMDAAPRPYLVMQRVHGLTLERTIERGELDMVAALDIADGILAGLGEMHAAGVGHLDIKPDNVVLQGDDRIPTLVDFGLAGRLVRPRSGAPGYAAPEVWCDETRASARAADVYSAACLVFEILTGQPLFDGETLMATITQHLSHDGWPPPLVALRHRPETAKVAEVIARALSPQPADRPNIVAFRAALARASMPLRSTAWPVATRVRWNSSPFDLRGLEEGPELSLGTLSDAG